MTAHAASEPTPALDIARFRPLLLSGDDAFSLADTIFPDPQQSANTKLLHLLRLSVLKRFLRALLLLSQLDTGPEARRSLTTLMRCIERLPDDVLLRVGMRPHVFSWAIFAIEAAQKDDRPEAARLVAHLGDFLSGTLREQSVLMPDETLLVSESGPLETAPHLIGTKGPVVLRDDSWLDERYPKSQASRASPLALGMPEHAFAAYRKTISEGASLVQTLWPEAWACIVEEIACIVPLASFGRTAHNESVHALRGLIALGARRAPQGAQSLVHETGHNRFSGICDLFVLFDNPEAVAYSPFVDGDRPLEAIAHGLFSFLQDLAMTARLGGPEAAQYFDFTRRKVERGLSTLRRAARPTLRGEELIAGFDTALESVD